MGYFNLLLFMLWGTVLMAQTSKISPFFPRDDNKSADYSEVCTNSNTQIIPDEEVEKLVTTIMEKAFGLPNRFIIRPCPGSENFEAKLHPTTGKEYILYNPEFSRKVKKLQFTSADVTKAFSQEYWEKLTILAHEVAHHQLKHLNHGDEIKASLPELELEADEMAGYIMYKLGATLKQAQSVMRRPEVSEYGTESHPPRRRRLDEIEKGFKRAIDQNATNFEALRLQKTLPGYLGLSGVSGLGGGLVLLGVRKWNEANIWYNKYKIEPINYTNGDFEKYRSDYSTNSKLFMGLGTAVMIGGAVIFLKKIAKVNAHNRSANEGRLSSSPHKHSFKIEPLLGNTQEGLPGVGIGVRFGRE